MSKAPRPVDPRRPALTRRGSLPPFYAGPHSPPATSRSSNGPTPDRPPPTNLLQLLSVAAASASLSVLATAGVFATWVKRMAPPKLHFKPTAANLELIRSMPLLGRTYVPNLLSWNAHAAGFFGYVKLPGKAPHRVERITLPDGGTVALSWSGEAADGDPITLLLPGINNDSSMGYLRHLMSMLEDEGLGHAAVLDWRGLGESGGLTATTCTPKPYCAVMTPDVEAVLSHVRQKYPSSPLFGVGWSMGGGLLLRHLGEAGEACQLAGGMAVSPAISLRANLQSLESSWVGIAYIAIICGPLTHYFWKHRAAFARGPKALRFVRDVLRALCERSGYDNRLYGPLWGLSGKEEYWEKGSADAILADVRRPTLILHAEDDPICPVGAIPLATVSANPHLLCAVTRHGGHMGYTAGLSPLKQTWNDRVFMHFLRHLIARSERAGGAGGGTSRGPPPPATSERTGTAEQLPAAAGSAAAGAAVPPFPIFVGTPSRL